MGVCVYIYIYIHVCAHTSMYMCVYMHVCAHTCLYVQVHTHVYAYISMCKNVYVYVYVDMHFEMLTPTYNVCYSYIHVHTDIRVMRSCTGLCFFEGADEKKAAVVASGNVDIYQPYPTPRARALISFSSAIPYIQLSAFNGARVFQLSDSAGLRRGVCRRLSWLFNAEWRN